MEMPRVRPASLLPRGGGGGTSPLKEEIDDGVRSGNDPAIRAYALGENMSG